MKAAIYLRYGPPDVVQVKDVDKPVPKDNEVLIKVRAASVNPYDWHFMRGTPYPFRMASGLRKPKDNRLGADVAGQVEAVGKNITQFKPGDAVFGMIRGAFAEYACASESVVALKPANVTFEQAAAVPIAAFTALQALRNKGHVHQGQKILINGAAGGVGTFAVQIAKSFGAEVAGVCSTRNLDMVRSLGADQAIDYTQVDFTTSAQQYDLILDCIGNHSLLACRRVLLPRGLYLQVGGPSGPWMLGVLVRLVAMPVLSRFLSQNFAFVGAKSSKDDLTLLHDLMQAGKVTPVIDRCYSLTELREAIRYLEQGHARGKVIITFNEGRRTG
jgi:NADPH:quinone reductase-like Zn-dependent oxidoreductase